MLKNTGRSLAVMVSAVKRSRPLLCLFVRRPGVELVQLSHWRFCWSHAKRLSVKPGFHYPSWRPELTGDRFPLPFNSGTRAVLTGARFH